MRQYLIYSSWVHGALLAFAAFFLRGAFASKPQAQYYIDFIGGSKVVTMEKAADQAKAPEAAKKAPAAPKAPAEEKDDFAKSAGGELPKPSVLSSGASLIAEDKAVRAQEEKAVVADFSNFPYPWYITQVREALWNAWTARMPGSGSLKCVVRFEIDRDGSAKKVSISRSSGNRLFDAAAASSVDAAAPFPGLPDDFYEDRLVVNVEFKTSD